jgi:cellobiose transport system permease protein
VQVALSLASGVEFSVQALVMAGTLLGTLPLVLVFVLFGRQIIGGIMEGGVK